MPEELMTPQEVADYLRIAKQTVHKINGLPWLEPTGAKKARRMRREDLDAWIDSRVQWDREPILTGQKAAVTGHGTTKGQNP